MLKVFNGYFLKIKGWNSNDLFTPYASKIVELKRYNGEPPAGGKTRPKEGLRPSLVLIRT
jgi:hypothetical protein